MSNKEWFSSWFDSKYYHILYQNRDYAEAESFVSTLSKYLKPEKNARILDLACGKGRYAIFLNKLGFLDVTGADLSPQSIAHANTFANENLRFYTHDMRQPELHGPYHYVLNLFTSFGYFENNEEDQQVIHGIEQVLHPKGVLVLDYLNPQHVLDELIPQETKLLDGIHFHITKQVENGFIVKNIDFEIENQHHHYQERVKLLYPSHFERLFANTSFAIQNVFGNYNLETYNAQRSPRQIIIAQKIV